MSEVAIVIDNLVQFYSIKRGIDDLTRRKIEFDIYVPEDVSGNELAEYTYNTISELGYKALKKARKHHYKVALEPYPKIEHKVSLNGITYDYRIKFKYGLVSTKPKPEHSPEWTIFYDAVLVHSSYEYELLKIYTETRLIEPLKYDNWQKVPHQEEAKKTLLYMPTFGDVRSDDYPALMRVFQEMKKKYSIAIKAHHATQFRESEAEHNKFLHKIADRIYDSSTPIGEVLSNADAVLTGNSGSAFEALYLGLPVSIYLDNLTKYDLGITSLQHKLIDEKVIPWTNRPDEIPSIVDESFKRINVQNRTSNELFRPATIKTEEFSDVIDEYIKRNPQSDTRHQLRNQLVTYIDAIKRDRAVLSRELAQLKQVVNEYKYSASWRLTEPLRKAKRIIKGHKK